MKLLAILAALGLEQLRLVRWRGEAGRLYTRYLRWLEVRMTSFGPWPATAVALLPVLLVLLVDVLLMMWAWYAMLIWSIAVLYLLTGFRRLSRNVGEITGHLQKGDLSAARKTLHHWQGGNSLNLSSDAVALHTIEAGVLAAYRSVFGIVFWFLIFGPSSAALYWMLTLVAREWSDNPAGQDITLLAAARAELGRVARWLLFILDWLPIRILAFSFAITGNFEDAIYQWRAQPNEDAAFDNASNENLLLATAFGALGLTRDRQAPVVSKPAEAAEAETSTEAIAEDGESGLALNTEEAVDEEKDTLGPPPDGVPVTPGVLPSATGLIWRSLLFWLGVVLLMTVAYWSSHKV